MPRAYLERHGDPTALWDELVELGWYGVGLEADDGFGVPGLCLLSEQVGRRLAPTLLVDAAVTGRITGAAREEHVALAMIDLEGAETIGVVDGGGFRLSGAKIGVPHGGCAHAFGVTAMLDGESAFFIVRASEADVNEEESLDPTSASARVVFDHAAAEVACVNADVIRRAFAVGSVATAAEATGAASAALELAIAYALEREQFGRPIGSFQAVQHILAEAHVLRESSWSSVLYAAGALDEDLPEADEATTIAKAWVSRSAREVVEAALQVLGGIGFTWEHDLHLFLRRVLACEQRFGGAAHHEERLSDLLGEQVALTTGRG
jgi:alkylation response protein AidB-like acyl-CoA dehydrogenase